jgi:DNA-binding CsgD family transcriptional regulator/tetratricopeptide (TPR) repeat protein
VAEGTLPVALSSLIGRHREIEALTRLLTTARMVTVVGSGGAGKSRLALAAAARTSARFPNGVWWADLSPLGEADLLPGVVAAALQGLGSIAREQARYDEAYRLHEESMAIWAGLDEPAGVAASLDYLGFAAWLEGDYARASAHCAQALAFFEASGRRQETASALINLGASARYAGDTQRATERLTEALTISRQIGYTEGIAWALSELGAQTGSADMLRDGLRTHFRLGDRWRVASVLEAIAATMAGPEPATAATLLSASGELRKNLGTPVPPAERPAVEAARGAVEQALEPALFAKSWASGQSMPLPDAVELACQPAGPAPAPDGKAGLGTDLTERELAVLRLVSQGLTNREIGSRLFISPGTAGVHVSNILRKLGVTSRVQAAGIAREIGL